MSGIILNRHPTELDIGQKTINFTVINGKTKKNQFYNDKR